MSNNIVPIGCITSPEIKDTGFVSYSDFIDNVNSVEECIRKAETYGNLCSAKGSAKSSFGDKSDNKCSYVAYHDGNILDLLREADSEYQKSLNSQTVQEKEKYIESSLKLFQKIWLNYTPEERNCQLTGNCSKGIPYEQFLNNFAPWIKKNKKYMKFFEENVNSQRVPVKMKNLCWLGGKNVLDTKYTELVDFEKNKNPKCKYGLYVVPGTEGGNVSERLKKYYQQIAQKNKEKAKEASKKAQISNAMARFVNNPDSSKMDIFSLFKAAQKEKSKLEMEAATKDSKNSINNKLRAIKEQQRLAEMVNASHDTTRVAINRNIDLVKDKQKVFNKMNTDLQTLNWNLKESQEKEKLQNKITSVLGIIIILFSGLCIGVTLFYLLGDIPSLNNLKNKTNGNVLKNIFGVKNKKTAVNKKVFNKIFS